MRAFAEQVQIEIGQHAAVAIRIVDLDDLIAGIRDPQAIVRHARPATGSTGPTACLEPSAESPSASADLEHAGRIARSPSAPARRWRPAATLDRPRRRLERADDDRAAARRADRGRANGSRCVPRMSGGQRVVRRAGFWVDRHLLDLIGFMLEQGPLSRTHSEELNRQQIGRRASSRRAGRGRRVVALRVVARSRWQPGRAARRRRAAEVRQGRAEGRRADRRPALHRRRRRAGAAGASRNLDSYEELRKLDVPLDTEPAMTFRPVPAGQAARPAQSTRNAKLAIARPARVPVPSQPRGSRVRAGDRARGADREPQGDVDRSHQDVSRRGSSATAIRCTASSR